LNEFRTHDSSVKAGEDFHALAHAAIVIGAQHLDTSYSSHLIPALISLFGSLFHMFTVVAVVEMLSFTFVSLING
jgi:hypothetical protein